MWSELYKGKILIKDKVIGAIASNKSHLKKKRHKNCNLGGNVLEELVPWPVSHFLAALVAELSLDDF